MHNIEKSGFHRGEYVGYNDGPWRIVRTGSGWRATKQQPPFAVVSGLTLNEVSRKIENWGVKPNPTAPSMKAKRNDYAVFEFVHSYSGMHGRGGGESKSYRLVRVESASRDGSIKTFTEAPDFYGRAQQVSYARPAQTFLIPADSLSLVAFKDWLDQMARMQLQTRWETLAEAKHVIGSFRKGVRL